MYVKVARFRPNDHVISFSAESFVIRVCLLAVSSLYWEAFFLQMFSSKIEVYEPNIDTQLDVYVPTDAQNVVVVVVQLFLIRNFFNRVSSFN